MSLLSMIVSLILAGEIVVWIACGFFNMEYVDRVPVCLTYFVLVLLIAAHIRYRTKPHVDIRRNLERIVTDLKMIDQPMSVVPLDCVLLNERCKALLERLKWLMFCPDDQGDTDIVQFALGMAYENVRHTLDGRVIVVGELNENKDTVWLKRYIHCGSRSYCKSEDRHFFIPDPSLLA